MKIFWTIALIYFSIAAYGEYRSYKSIELNTIGIISFCLYELAR